jgi:type II secretory pathway component GspD/PulD (secretin)
VDDNLPSLPPSISISLQATPLHDVLRAIGAIAGAAVSIDERVPNAPVTIRFEKMATSTALDFLCKLAGADWRLNAQARELRVQPRAQ